MVCRALSNMLLLPWPSLAENEQQWQTRSTSHGSLVAALTREYRLLRGTVNIPPRQTDLNNGRYIFLCAWSDHWRHCPTLTVLSGSHSPAVKAVMQQTLHVLRDLVDSISGESTKSRQICYQSLQESVQVSLSIFPVFIQQPGQCLSHPHSLLSHNNRAAEESFENMFSKNSCIQQQPHQRHSFETLPELWVDSCFFFSEVTDEMLAFFLTLFQALRVQMGVAFTGQIIHTFLSMFTRFVFMIIDAFFACAGSITAVCEPLYCHLCVLQGTAGSQYFAGGQRRMSSGAEVPQNPAGGGSRAGSNLQALPAQHPRSLHRAGLPDRG